MKHRRQRRLFLRFRDHRDYDALTLLFDDTAPSLMSLASHLVRDTGSAEDLVQATFLVAIERAQAYDKERDVYPWLAGILVNKARQWNRLTDRTVDPDRLPERAGEPDPVVAAGGLEVSAALHGALEDLPENYRTVLVPYLEQGEAPRSIADRLGIAPGTARVRIHRGLDLLRKALPAGFAAGGLAALLPMRGLDYMRATVLQQARLAGEGAVVTGASGAAIAGVQALQLAGIAAGLALASGAAWMLAGKVLDEDAAGIEALEPLVESLDPPTVPPLKRAPVRDEAPPSPEPQRTLPYSEPLDSEPRASESDRELPEPREPGAVAALGWGTRVWTDSVPPGHVRLPGGYAVVGSPVEDIQAILQEHPDTGPFLDRLHAETPRHEVAVDELCAMRTEVTVEQYLAYVLDEGQRLAEQEQPDERALEKAMRQATQLLDTRGLDPYAGVDLDRAQAYAAWAGLRLPTEFEWQYAARGDSLTPYPWGQRWDGSKAAGLNHALGTGVVPVGSFPEGATREGLYDMAGNVAEWTISPYTAYPGFERVRYTLGSDGKKVLAWPDFAEMRRVVAGGSWRASPEFLRVAGRRPENRDVRSEEIGFRTFASLTPARDALAHAVAKASRAGELDLERVIGVDRWWVRTQLGLAGPEGYEVIVGYDHVGFAPVKQIDASSERDLNRLARRRPVVLGLLSTNQPILEPRLDPGLYVLQLSSGEDRWTLRLASADGGEGALLDSSMLTVRNGKAAEHKQVQRDGEIRIGVGIPCARKGTVAELNFGLMIGSGPWRK